MVKCRDWTYSKVAEGSEVGRLTVLSCVGVKSGNNYWNCICECGNILEVKASSLNSGLKQSCGCKYRQSRKSCGTTHGLGKSTTYNSWTAMKQRCYYPKGDYYHLYGGRGIKVCLEWRDSFSTFYKDMGERPKGLTLDRLDSNGDYSKANCKWSTPQEQSRNIRYKKEGKDTPMGVSWHKGVKKWQANIGVDNKSLYLGVYTTKDAAIAARKKAEELYFE